MAATKATINEAADKFVLDVNGFFATSGKATIAIDLTSATPFTLAGAAGETVTLTYVTNTGLTDSIVITVK